jgi:hypothetical protein
MIGLTQTYRDDAGARIIAPHGLSVTEAFPLCDTTPGAVETGAICGRPSTALAGAGRTKACDGSSQSIIALSPLAGPIAISTDCADSLWFTSTYT